MFRLSNSIYLCGEIILIKKLISCDSARGCTDRSVFSLFSHDCQGSNQSHIWFAASQIYTHALLDKGFMIITDFCHSHTRAKTTTLFHTWLACCCQNRIGELKFQYASCVFCVTFWKQCFGKSTHQTQEESSMRKKANCNQPIRRLKKIVMSWENCNQCIYRTTT